MSTSLAGNPAGGEPSGVSIRPLERGEHAALWPLLCGMSGDAAASERMPAEVADRIARVQERADHCIVVAAAGACLVGYAWVQDYGPGLRREWSVARLHDLYVAPGWRRRGIGRALFAAVREWATRRGTVRYLEWQASRAALAFYRRLGFTGDTRSDLEAHPYFEVRLQA
jgi:GNAT superfamily N-acetyltransferase